MTLNEPPKIKIQPTVSNRLGNLDLLRGIAILGILIANITAFSTVNIVHEFIGGNAFHTNAEQWTEAIRNLLVSGKFRGMLCFLFGVGMYLQFEKRTDKGLPWPGTYLKRTLWLAAIGAIHGLIFWHGDILFVYSITALAAMFVVKQDAKFSYIIMGVGLLAGIGLALIGSVSANAGAGGGPESFGPLNEYISISAENQAFQSGSYGIQFLYRGAMTILAMTSAPFIAFDLIPLFLAGFLVARTGFFRNPLEHKKLLKYGFIMLPVGLILNSIPLILKASNIKYDFSLFNELFFSHFLVLGYLALFTWLYAIIPWKAIWKPVQNVGQMALTSYLLQTLCMTTYFYSYGFAKFGTMNQVEVLLVIAGMWVINMLVAALWLHFYKMGPIEYLWRRVSIGEPIKIKREKEIKAPA